MGYCSGAWFSDYSYVRIEQFLESYAARTARSTSVGASVLAADNGYLTISGSITANGVQLLRPWPRPAPYRQRRQRRHLQPAHPDGVRTNDERAI